MITSLYSLSRRRSEYRLVITEPKATNCFSINFQVFKKNQHNCIKIYFRKNICKNSLFFFSLQNSLFTKVLDSVSRCDEANFLSNKNT